LLGFVSAYVLVRGNEAAIVDTGTSDSGDAILEGLEAMAVSPAMVRHIVLTHNHGDHVGGLANLEGILSNAVVHAGAADIGSIQSSLTLSELSDGDEVFGMGVIGTPGHTPGSISLFDTASGILVAGDAINGDGNGGITGADPGFSSDLDAAAASVAKLAALAPVTVAFGHGGAPVTEDVTAKLAALS
jgi:glyoxylase-like metal-dependent hydrolase (beta-lactamase superfamily II)